GRMSGFNGATWTVAEAIADTLSAMISDDPEPHLPFEGPPNLGEVGGYPAAGGRRTRWRTLLRSDELTALSPQAQADLVALGVRQVVDLRWPDELERAPNV